MHKAFTKSESVESVLSLTTLKECYKATCKHAKKLSQCISSQQAWLILCNKLWPIGTYKVCMSRIKHSWLVISNVALTITVSWLVSNSKNSFWRISVSVIYEVTISLPIAKNSHQASTAGTMTWLKRIWGVCCVLLLWISWSVSWSCTQDVTCWESSPDLVTGNSIRYVIQEHHCCFSWAAGMVVIFWAFWVPQKMEYSCVRFFSCLHLSRPKSSKESTLSTENVIATTTDCAVHATSKHCSTFNLYPLIHSPRLLCWHRDWLFCACSLLYVCNNRRWESCCLSMCS